MGDQNNANDILSIIGGQKQKSLSQYKKVLPESKTRQISPPLDDSAMSKDSNESLLDIVQELLKEPVVNLFQCSGQEALEVNYKYYLVHFLLKVVILK